MQEISCLSKQVVFYIPNSDGLVLTAKSIHDMKSKIVRALTNACIQYKTAALYRKFVHMGFECLCATDFYFLISTCKPNSG